MDGQNINNINCAICIYPFTKKNEGQKIIKVIENNKSSIECEYIALIEALKIVTEESFIFTDNMQIYREINNLDNPSELTKDLFKESKEMYDELNKKYLVRIQWIIRSDNKAGKFLEERLEKIHNYMDKSAHDFIGLNKKNRRKKYKKYKYFKNRGKKH